MKIIFHNKDLDGICSGAILHMEFPKAQLIGYDYGQSFDVNSIEEGEDVFMADVSMPMDMMEEIAIRSGQFVWIDHHVSAMKDFKSHFSDWRLHADGGMSALDGEMLYAYDDSISACEGCWNYCNDYMMPRCVNLLGKYDTWRKDGTWDSETLPFQYGMRLHGFTPETLAIWIGEMHGTDRIVEQGKTILEYQRQQNIYQISRYAFTAEISVNGRTYRAICCNGVQPNSQSFDSVWDETKYDVMVPFGYNGQNWGLSFYTTKVDVDCSEIAKSFGGGGHKKAAGVNGILDISTVLIKN